jgi:hypothetical protein
MIIAAAIEVHRTLGGAGLLERVYEEALVFELMQRALQVERQKMFPLVYKGHSFCGWTWWLGDWSSSNAKPLRTTIPGSERKH